MYTVFAQDDVLFDHLTRALCRNKVDMVQLLAEIIEALEGNLSRFIKDRLMQLYIEVRNYEITKRILKHLGFFTLTFRRRADGQYHLFNDFCGI